MLTECLEQITGIRVRAFVLGTVRDGTVRQSERRRDRDQIRWPMGLHLPDRDVHHERLQRRRSVAWARVRIDSGACRSAP